MTEKEVKVVRAKRAIRGCIVNGIRYAHHKIDPMTLNCVRCGQPGRIR